MINKHDAEYIRSSLFSQTCKYCGCDLVFDVSNNEYVGYLNNFQECISDEEKIIKALLE